MIWLAMLVLGEQAPLTPVAVRNESELLTSDDYVTRAAGLGKSGYTVVEVLVDATGKPQTCGVAATSGSKDLDVRACAAAVLRGKYTPAADEKGLPMYGVHRLRVRWVLESFFDGAAGTPKWPADLVLEVAKLPEGRRSVAVALAYFVDEQGAIAHPGDPYLQARRALEIIVGALAQAGAAPAHVVRTRMYVADAAR